MLSHKVWARLSIVALGALVALPAHAYDPVLHEFIPPDDGEDLAMSVTRDAAGNVLERHVVKACSTPVECEVR